MKSSTSTNLLIDCSFGVSGDMIVGALLSLGADKDKLRKSIDSLNLDSYTIKITDKSDNSRIITDFDVELKDNHDNDMEYLFGDKRIEQNNFIRRNIEDVFKILDNSILTNSAKDIAKKIFSIIARAEAKAHKISVNEVVFHESGAMDSIIDITSIAVCLDDLAVDKVYIQNLVEGKGKIQTRVGMLDIPTPAVKNIADEFNIKIKRTDFPYELITPTGLGALAGIGDFNNAKNYKIIKEGYGLGKRKYYTPRTLKIMLIKNK